MDISKFVEWLKLGIRELCAIAICTSLLLYLPQKAIEKIGLSTFINSYKAWIGVIWIGSLSLLLSVCFIKLYNSLRRRYQLKKIEKLRIQRLQKLTVEEREVLSQYISSQTRTQAFKYSDGVIRELEAFKIISRSSEIAHRFDIFPFNIQPWAWDYLNEHPELLDIEQ